MTSTPLIEALKRRARFKQHAVTHDDADRTRVRREAFRLDCDVFLAESRAGKDAWRQLPRFYRCKICLKLHSVTVTVCDGEGRMMYELDLLLGVNAYTVER